MCVKWEHGYEKESHGNQNRDWAVFSALISKKQEDPSPSFVLLFFLYLHTTKSAHSNFKAKKKIINKKKKQKKKSVAALYQSKHENVC